MAESNGDLPQHFVFLIPLTNDFPELEAALDTYSLTRCLAAATAALRSGRDPLPRNSIILYTHWVSRNPHMEKANPRTYARVLEALLWGASPPSSADTPTPLPRDWPLSLCNSVTRLICDVILDLDMAGFHVSLLQLLIRTLATASLGALLDPRGPCLNSDDYGVFGEDVCMLAAGGLSKLLGAAPQLPCLLKSLALGPGELAALLGGALMVEELPVGGTRDTLLGEGGGGL